jgi:hypothetical protein
LALLIPCPEQQQQQFVATPFAMQREKELSGLERGAGAMIEDADWQSTDVVMFLLFLRTW